MKRYSRGGNGVFPTEPPGMDSIDTGIGWKDERLWLLVLAGVAATLRFSGLGLHSLWFDEGFSFRDSATLQNALRSFHAPAYFILLKFWTTLFGDSNGSGRALSAIFGTLAVFPVWALAERFFGKAVAWSATVLYVIAPMAIWHSREVRMYSIWAFCCLVSFHSLIRYMEDGERTRDRIHYWMAAVLSIAVHYYGAIFQLALCVGSIAFFRVDGNGKRRRIFTSFSRLFWPLPAISIGIVMIKLTYRYQMPLLSAKVQALLSGLRDTGDWKPAWTIPYESLFFHYWYDPGFPVGGRALTLAILILVVAGMVLFAWDSKVSLPRRGMLLTFILVPFFSIILTGIRRDLRMFFPLLAFALMLISYLFFRATQWSERWGSALAWTALMLLGLSWYPLVRTVLVQDPFPVRQLCADVASRWVDGDVFVSIAGNEDEHDLFARECGMSVGRMMRFTTKKFRPEEEAKLQAVLAPNLRRPRLWLVIIYPEYEVQQLLLFFERSGYHPFLTRIYHPTLGLAGLRLKTPLPTR